MSSRPQHILGISAFYHDSAVALLRDGIPVAAAQEERFTRRKNDPAFPKRAVRFCLREGGLGASDLDWVVFYEKPLRKFERILVTQMRSFPRAGRAFSRAMFQWLGDRLWIKNRIAAELGIDPDKVHFTEHHRSHAASAFYPSPFDEAAILTVDGVGEWATTCLSKGQGGSIETLAEIRFPNSLGLFYSALTAYLGFEVNSGEQKVMAMAAMGEPSYAEVLSQLLGQQEDGSLHLDLKPFRFHFDPERSFGPELEELLGPARSPEQGEFEQRHFDIAASLQQVTERALLTLARELHAKVGSDRLCLAGGVALNVVANTKVLQEGPFSELFVQPAAGDAGGALGAALELHHRLGGAPRVWRQEHSFLGEEVREEPREGSFRTLEDDEALVRAMVERLTAGDTVGWVRGRFEWGPRALGHRSLLADPRQRQMADHINQRIKQRELFRPFAPAVPAERAEELFVLQPGGLQPSRYMLLALDARPEARKLVPAVLHSDGSARVQLVHRDQDPLFHRLLTAFGEATGVPVLLNTSLNLRGEPIVRGEEDALEVFDRSELDCLVVERRLYVDPQLRSRGDRMARLTAAKRGGLDIDENAIKDQAGA